MKRLLPVLVVMTLNGGLAHAQGGPSEADLKLAKQHHQLGTTYYDQGAYDKALEAFKESYKLSKRPELLYNIAKCHESLGHLEEAIAHYRRYLSETGKEDATISARIRNLEARLEAQKAPPPATQPTAEPATQPTAAPTPPPEPPRQPAPEPAPPPAQGTSWKTIAGWSLIGLGVAALGAGIAMGAVSSAKATEVEDGYKVGNLDWADFKDVEASGEGLEVGMIVGVCVGAAAAVGGAALLLLSRGGGERRASVSPLLGRDVVGLTGSISF